MGVSMCGHLIQRGHPAFVYTRTPSKAQPLLDAGATWCDSPQAVARHAKIVFSIVGFPADVRDVLLGPQGALSGCAVGNILVDMTTSEPQLAKEIARRRSRNPS